MRSAVSVILSTPVPDPNMSHPDFEQTSYHHAAILILVKHLGEELSQKGFNKIFDRISRVNNVKITDSLGATRSIWARYVKDYPLGNNDWGDFQSHRRLLGLITVGKSKTQIEFNEMCRIHESLKVRYVTTLYDSRCVMFGINDGPDVPHFSVPANFKSRALYFATDGDESSPLEEHISEYLSSLFWVLESKRHERSREKADRVSMLFAPVEKKDFVGADFESRTNKRRSVGRMTKHLGDLCLQAGLPSEALTFYHTAADTLRSTNDLLWLGGACEGLSSASVCIKYPFNNKTSVQRNTSLQETSKNRPSLGKSPGKELSEPSSLSLPSIPNNVLNDDEIFRHFRESVIHYSKYQSAAVIETEVSFKAARVAVDLNAVLQAASFLQNIIFITLTAPEEQKIARLMTISELYSKLGFRRKASFYLKLAAARYVSAKNPQTNWDQCYNLMLQSLPGHRLTLDPADYPVGGENGWGRLQKQVLQDVVEAAKRVGHSSLATRHMTLLLQVLWSELTRQERHECALQLQSIAAQCEGSPIPLILDSGLVIPPANLIHIPTAESFVVHKLKPNFQPIKLDKIKEDYGPFLFTPFKFGSLERNPTPRDGKLSFLWVAEEECQVRLELTNPLPFELEVSNMRLLTTGVVFETLPVTVTLPPEVHKYPVTLAGTPKEVGELEITGYSTHTLGVKSNCKLKILPKIPHRHFTVEVVPAMPLLEASWSMDNHSNSTAIVLFAGESAEGSLVLENLGKDSVELIDVSTDCALDQNVISCDTSSLPGQLPLAEGGKITLPLRIFAAAQFVNTFPTTAETGSVRSSLFSGTSSFPSLNSLKPSGVYDNLTTPTPSFRSGPSSLNSLNSQFNRLNIDNSAKGIECRIEIKYSGGPGLTAGYCRLATVIIHVDISNSILITNWDVLPAETSSQFYMVLDVTNMTNQEVEVQYTANKSLLIEENESCRVPIPVDRCPLAVIGKYFQSEGSIKEIVDLNAACSKHIVSLVEVEWIMGNKSGKANLKGITLSSHMLDIVRMSPIIWDIWVDGVEGVTGVPHSVNLGECVQLSAQARNALDRPLNDIALSLLFFQDYQNGTCNFNLDTRLAIAGPSHVHLATVEEHQSVKMECSVVFFNVGQYKLNVQCTSLGRHTWKLMPPIEFDVVDA